ncbi:transcriptional regulator with XRE-family HTH domain [Desulfohalotomaculum tongense]|uniref:helix-turn-helix domain-containing protein n=1 Tax=Desulforadius tongensis TaxID=1216062 RepID=UPI0019565EE4|nr:XRE family transcriptional regulator [Desulforadius tongensis]MBM7855585.1 transcriptional regulator with XRE-family HTH domain [Desulforadius tongensis]
MSLGERIKQLRLNNNLSVRQLARQVGVTASFIYQLEQNKVSPSFSTLKSIAGALNTNISLLIEEELPEEWVIVRKNNRKRLASNNEKVKLEMLAFLGTRNKKMQPLVFELEVGEEKTDLSLFSGSHEDFIYVFQGKVEVTVKNTKYVVEEGDAAYFIFDNPTGFKNIGQEKVIGLWVVSPPGI